MRKLSVESEVYYKHTEVMVIVWSVRAASNLGFVKAAVHAVKPVFTRKEFIIRKVKKVI